MSCSVFPSQQHCCEHNHKLPHRTSHLTKEHPASGSSPSHCQGSYLHVIDEFVPLLYSSLIFTDNISNHSCSISLSHSIYIHKHMVNGERQWHHANHLLIDSTLTHSSMCCQARAFSCSESRNVLGQNWIVQLGPQGVTIYRQRLYWFALLAEELSSTFALFVALAASRCIFLLLLEGMLAISNSINAGKRPKLRFCTLVYEWMHWATSEIFMWCLCLGAPCTVHTKAEKGVQPCVCICLWFLCHSVTCSSVFAVPELVFNSSFLVSVMLDLACLLDSALKFQIYSRVKNG